MRKYPAIDVAAFIVKAFIDRDKPITNLQLQKIMFFAQCDYMQQNGGEVIFEEPFEAWQYGPVVPSVYSAYAPYGGSPITRPAKFRSVRYFDGGQGEVEDLDGAERQSVLDSLKHWGDLPAWRLVELSHSPKGAWYQVYNMNGQPGSGYRKEIPVSLIKETLEIA